MDIQELTCGTRFALMGPNHLRLLSVVLDLPNGFFKNRSFHLQLADLYCRVAPVPDMRESLFLVGPKARLCIFPKSSPFQLDICVGCSSNLAASSCHGFYCSLTPQWPLWALNDATEISFLISSYFDRVKLQPVTCCPKIWGSNL